jgi:hypothetical protein
VLEDVAEQDRLVGRERRELAARGGVLDVADDDALAVRARPFGRVRIGLDADDAAAAPGQLGGQVAGRAADVEHARAAGHGVEEQPVRGREAVLGDERRVRGLRLIVERGQRKGS